MVTPDHRLAHIQPQNSQRFGLNIHGKMMIGTTAPTFLHERKLNIDFHNSTPSKTC